MYFMIILELLIICLKSLKIAKKCFNVTTIGEGTKSLREVIVEIANALKTNVCTEDDLKINIMKLVKY